MLLLVGISCLEIGRGVPDACTPGDEKGESIGLAGVEEAAATGAGCCLSKDITMCGAVACSQACVKLRKEATLAKGFGECAGDIEPVPMNPISSGVNGDKGIIAVNIGDT